MCLKYNMRDKFADGVRSMVEYPDEECNRSMRRGLDGCMFTVGEMCNGSMSTSRNCRMCLFGIVFRKCVSEDECIVVSVLVGQIS